MKWFGGQCINPAYVNAYMNTTRMQNVFIQAVAIYFSKTTYPYSVLTYLSLCNHLNNFLIKRAAVAPRDSIFFPLRDVTPAEYYRHA